MKIKNDSFILRKIADENIVVPIGEKASCLSGVIRLNDTSAFLWSVLSEEIPEEDVIGLYMEKYELDYNLAEEHFHYFVTKLKELDCLED